MTTLQKTFYAITASCALLVWGCDSSAPAVATIGPETITLPEFERSYAKNNGGLEAGRASSLTQREEFLDLLVKFRLKVLEARNRGIQNDPEIKTEILGYELSVAESYLIEKELIEPNIRRLYDRKKEEIHASHILIRTEPTPSPEDTLEAYQRALDIIAKVPAANFDSLAARYSEEPNALVSKGDLGYFSVGRMVPEFEDAAYSLRAGEHTKAPIRTRFGYHILKVHERIPNKGQIRISFIIMHYPPGGDTAAVKDTAWMLYRRLKDGENFAVLAQLYSHDFSSGYRGGDVGFYDKDRLPPQIAKVLTHTPKDSVSEPLFLENGLYIFKVTDVKGIPAFEEAKAGLRQMYQQMRFERDLAGYLDGLRRRYAFRIDESARTAFERGFADSTRTPRDSAWNTLTDPQLAARTLITYDGGSATVEQVLSLIASKAEFHDTKLTPAGVGRMIDQIAQQMLFLEHARRSSRYRDEFASLMNDYRDGILLYQIEQEEIWSKVQVNDSLLKEFHAPRKEKYRMPERVNIAEIYVPSDSLAQVALNRVRRGEDFLAVAEDMTMRAGYRDKKGVWGFQPTTTNEMTQIGAHLKVDSVSKPFRNGVGWSVIKVLEKDSARTKTFEEASLEVTSEYQEYAAKLREKAWIDGLKSKYGVTTDREKLTQAFTREERDAQ